MPVALLLALIIYGCFGRPAPQTVTQTELAIAVLLLVGTGWKSCLEIASAARLRRTDLYPWELAGLLALCWMLTVPLVRGVAAGWSTEDIVRDILPLLFLFLPMILARVEGTVSALAGGLAFAGVTFALRWWWDSGLVPGQLGTARGEEGADYLLNSSAVLFAAVWLPLKSLERGFWQSAVKRLILMTGGVICLVALAVTIHRAALLAVGAAYGIALFMLFLRRPRMAVVLLGLIVLGIWALSDPIHALAANVWEKTRLVGDNARWLEIAATLDQTGTTWVSLLLGQGWGALLINPAVGEWRVSYTHAFPTYLLFKTGLAGLGLMAFYLLLLLRQGLRLWDKTTLLAIAGPLTIGFLLHTSYKYLCFGLLLSLFVVDAGTSVNRDEKISRTS